MSSAVFDRTNVGALIPSYFEETQIADVVRRTLTQLDTVLVIDDGSTDRTSDVARSAGAEVIRHGINAGKGEAIKTGLRELGDRAHLHALLVLDGDGQHLPEEIPRFLAAASNSPARLWVGNRMGDVRAMPLVRKLTNRTMSALISQVCGQTIPDTQCGFRMIHRGLADLLCEATSSRYDFETEMLAIAARHGFAIAAVPVSTVYGAEKSKIHPLRDTVRFYKLWRRLKRQAQPQPVAAPAES